MPVNFKSYKIIDLSEGHDDKQYIAELSGVDDSDGSAATAEYNSKALSYAIPHMANNGRDTSLPEEALRDLRAKEANSALEM